MYYFLKDMMRDEIKDFYIKTEKTKLKKNKKDNIESNQPYKMDDLQLDQEIYDMEINEEVNNIEIESFIDPIKNNDQNQVLSDRIFNI